MKSPEYLVRRFYDEVWNRSDENTAYEILDQEFRFRGSLGSETVGPGGFIDYVRSIHRALANYTCRIDDLIVTEERAAARMMFEGVHRAEFFGVSATGRKISWAGAAFFMTRDDKIAELWVLGDVDSIRRQLGTTS
ncbi:MAG: ester cyclase [Pseudomonadota bacterium]